MTPWRMCLIAATVCSALLAPGAGAQPTSGGDAQYKPEIGQSGKDVVWVPTSQTLVDRMLDMVGLTPQDRLVDLGAGDGRLVITAARRGATARGIEYNPDMVALSRRLAAAEGMAGRVSLEEGDIFKSDFSNATVVTLFLLPDLNMRLRPTLLAMAPGTRIVSNSFDMGDWLPDESSFVKDGCTGYCNALKWTVPARAEGTWALDGNRELVLRQSFQMLDGTLRDGPVSLPISDARLDGTRIRFTAGGKRYSGEVTGNQMRGTIDGGGAWSASQAGR